MQTKAVKQTNWAFTESPQCFHEHWHVIKSMSFFEVTFIVVVVVVVVAVTVVIVLLVVVSLRQFLRHLET